MEDFGQQITDAGVDSLLFVAQRQIADGDRRYSHLQHKKCYENGTEVVLAHLDSYWFQSYLEIVSK